MQRDFVLPLGFQEHKLPARYLKLRPGENFEGCNRTVEDLLDRALVAKQVEEVVACPFLGAVYGPQ